MKAVFVSDSHLQNSTDRRALRFLSFLQEEVSSADALYIVGDLFDYWLPENRLLEDRFLPITEWLERYSRHGKIAYVLGNHDFFIEDFAKERWGAEIFQDGRIIEMSGQQIYLAHGDRVYGKDYGYRVLRRLLRNRWTKRVAERLPEALALKIAQRMSGTSRIYTTLYKNIDCRAIYRAFARERVAEGADVVILGHNHLPDFYEIEIGPRKGLYLNTGDWLAHSSYLTFDGDRWELKKRDLSR